MAETGPFMGFAVQGRMTANEHTIKMGQACLIPPLLRIEIRVRLADNGPMRNLFLLLLSVVTAALAAGLFVIIQEQDISTAEIDQDRAAVTQEIASAEMDAAKYTGGAIKAFIDMRHAILRSTLAMLDQKRASFIRRINLTYTIDGKPVPRASDTELRDILDDLTQAKDRIENSKREASQYGSGLLQSMSLLKVATEELGASSLMLRFYSAKYGIPIHVPSIETKSPDKTSPGTVVEDRKAL